MCVYLSLAGVLRYKARGFLRLIPRGVAHHIALPANKNTAAINTWKHSYLLTYLLTYFLALWPFNSLCLLNMEMHVTDFFEIKSTRCTNFTNLFCRETLRVSDSSSVPSWTDELSETWSVSWQNKFVKLVHLVDFISYKFVTMHAHMYVKKNITHTTIARFRQAGTWSYHIFDERKHKYFSFKVPYEHKNETTNM